MCDTLCSLNLNNENKSITYFAKNSDREPNEIQVVEYYPSIERKGKTKLTYIEVETLGITNEIVISRPEWMWGAEMGFNEHGVSIGNEAIFTRNHLPSKGLLGMDLLRLGLEYGNNARKSADVIISYLEQYGQGGSNSKNSKFHYDNSFLISDYETCYILETIGKEWRIKKINNFGSISNSITDNVSSSERNQSKNFNPSQRILMTGFGKGIVRQKFTQNALLDIKGKTSLDYIMKIMRSHSKDSYMPAKGSNRDVCMHAGSTIRRNQTVNSMITEIGKDFVIAWFTFSSNPCISLYKPLIFKKKSINNIENIMYDKNYWINSEKIHRRLIMSPLSDYVESMKFVELMQKNVNNIMEPIRLNLISGGDINRRDIDLKYQEINKLDRKVLDWLSIKGKNVDKRIPLLYRRWWKKVNKNIFL
ncbi:MAG: peptidase U34 [Thermoplasmata archaeon]